MKYYKVILTYETLIDVEKELDELKAKEEVKKRLVNTDSETLFKDDNFITIKEVVNKKEIESLKRKRDVLAIVSFFQDREIK